MKVFFYMPITLLENRIMQARFDEKQIISLLEYMPSSVDSETSACLIKHFEDWQSEYALNEVEAIIRSDQNASIRHAAFLYLMTRASLEMIQTLSIFMDFNYCDSTGHGVIHYAVRKGRIDVLDWLIKEKKQLLDSVDNAKNPPILKAAVNGQVAMLEHLVNTHKLSLDVEDKDGNNALVVAILNGRLEMANHLIDKHGFTLSPNLVEECLRDTWRNKNINTFRWVLEQAFRNKKLDNEVEALNWAKIKLSEYQFADCEQGELVQLIAAKCRESINNHFQLLSSHDHDANTVSDNIQRVVDVYEALLPGESYLVVLSKLYQEEHQFGMAYNACSSIMRRHKYPESVRWQAGFEMASMVLTGSVELQQDGSLDQDKTSIAEDAMTVIVSNDSAPKRRKIMDESLREEGLEKAVMIKRALHCLVILQGNTLPEAIALKVRVTDYLSYYLDNKKQSIAWHPIAVGEAVECYRKNKQYLVLMEQPGFLNYVSSATRPFSSQNGKMTPESINSHLLTSVKTLFTNPGKFSETRGTKRPSDVLRQSF